MHEHAYADNLLEAVFLESARDLDQFYCVEIPVTAKLIYQFKIWQSDPVFMSILVKEDSRFLTFVEISSKFNMKFYSDDFLYPHQELVTEIRDISLQECGRLKGHYLVSLEIIEEAEDQKINDILLRDRHENSGDRDM